MCNKIFLAIGSCALIYQSVSAANSSNDSNYKMVNSKISAPNNPTVGARAGSNQIFGHQTRTPNADNNKYYSGNNKKGTNQPTTGSRSGSEQTFGHHQLQIGTKTQQISSPNKKPQNSSTVGSRSSSEQVFGHP